MIIKLSIRNGDEKGKTEDFNSLPITIGRNPSNNFTISDITVSRKHAIIYISESDHCIIIKDFDSTNGTYVNKNKLQPSLPIKINNNDLIFIGSNIIELNIIAND